MIYTGIEEQPHCIQVCVEIIQLLQSLYRTAQIYNEEYKSENLWDPSLFINTGRQRRPQKRKRPGSQAFQQIFRGHRAHSLFRQAPGARGPLAFPGLPQPIPVALGANLRAWVASFRVWAFPAADAVCLSSHFFATALLQNHTQNTLPFSGVTAGYYGA